MAASGIEWTEQTWNPVTGCTKVSPGCKYCYAEVMARRLRAMNASGYENGFRTTLHPERLSQPLSRKKPTVYFVNSMSDLFHPDVPFAFIEQVMATIAATPQHTYQILTKRAGRMRQFFERRAVPDNAWLGVSVEDQKYGLPRIPQLLKINARTRFLSVEPLLQDLGDFSMQGIDWIIVGGESGHKARPMQESWALSVQRIAQRDGALFFFKQWGSYGADGMKRNKKANGRELSGRTWDAMPELIAVG